MKKLAAIFLTMVLILGLGTTAFATEGPGMDAPVTVETTERSYNGYQLFTLTISLKQGTHHPASCDGSNHTDDCYNYAYALSKDEKGVEYRKILQQEVFTNAGATFWGSGKPTEWTGVSDDQILDYFEMQSGDTGEPYGSLRGVADRIYAKILEKGLEPEVKSLKANTHLEQGYWLLADVTDLSGKNEANSLVLLDTQGQINITIAPKTAIPELVKKVKDIEDSEADSISDKPWLDSADHDIDNQPIPFKLTATLPSNAQQYKTYKMVFHDTMDKGFDLKADSIKVLMYETKFKADVDTDLNDAMSDVTSKFTVNTTDLTHDDCDFEVICNNVYSISGVTKDTAFVVYYEATLNEHAEIGEKGNVNEAYLEFSNNPYAEGTGFTEKDRVKVFTYQLIVNKTDSHGHELEGAGFKLYKKAVDGTYTIIGAEQKGADMTTFTWTGLDDGDYKLEESTVPEGYNKIPDIIFSISATHSEEADEPQLLSLDGGLAMGAGVVETGAITKDIENHTGTVLPQTGAKGTRMLIGGGSVFALLAAIFMVTRKKMSIYED